MFESQDSWTILLVAGLIFFKLMALGKFVSKPLGQGQDWFFTTQVGPDFYEAEGRKFLLRYRLWLIVPVAFDALLGISFLILGKFSFALYEAAAAYLILVAYFNFVLIQFAYKSKRFSIRPPDEVKITAAQLTLETRKLRDFTSRTIELIIIFFNLAPILQLTFFYIFPAKINVAAGEWKPDVWLWAWLFYLQIGLLFLKQIFIKWRYKLPLRRVDDFKRWRSAWLHYHLDVIDSIRILLAFILFNLTTAELLGETSDFSNALSISMGLNILAGIFVIVRSVRKYQELMRIAEEIKPVTLVKEFPPSPVAEGRFFAGGLLYINSDNPFMFARSPQGLALNLAHRGLYLWTAYLAGLILLIVW